MEIGWLFDVYNIPNADENKFRKLAAILINLMSVDMIICTLVRTIRLLT